MTTLADRVKVWEAELLERGEGRGIEKGMEQGIKRGAQRERGFQRTMLARQAGRKFGPEAAYELAARIDRVPNPEELALVGDWIIDCDGGEDLLELVDEARRDAWRREFLSEGKGLTWLANRVKIWEAELLERGEERGIELGIDQGIDQGIQRSIQRGRERLRTMLARQAGRKFGPAIEHEFTKRIAGVSDPEELAMVGERIIDCEAGNDLLELVTKPG